MLTIAPMSLDMDKGTVDVLLLLLLSIQYVLDVLYSCTNVCFLHRYANDNLWCHLVSLLNIFSQH